MLEPLATVTNYVDLIVALRARCDALRISREALDHISGLQSGYAGKLLAMPRPQTSMRVLGRTSFDLMLPALGVKLVMVEDEAAMPRLRKRLADPRAELAGQIETAKHRGKHKLRTWPSGNILARYCDIGRSRPSSKTTGKTAHCDCATCSAGTLAAGA